MARHRHLRRGAQCGCLVLPSLLPSEALQLPGQTSPLGKGPPCSATICMDLVKWMVKWVVGKHLKICHLCFSLALNPGCMLLGPLSTSLCPTLLTPPPGHGLRGPRLAGCLLGTQVLSILGLGSPSLSHTHCSSIPRQLVSSWDAL